MSVTFVMRNRMTRITVLIGAGLAACLLVFGDRASTSPITQGKQSPKSQSAVDDAQGFEKLVRPALVDACIGCHNDRTGSGGLNLVLFMADSSIAGRRDEWEVIAQRVEAGEMPPPGAPKDTAQLNAMVAFLKKAF